eukprot:TRINITY_DN18683_c0_g1_i1.p1 TRINITY_DN18683_c0_g1~~TRINITY_DN18683_c0_g1_i1.p1  ORF type:complete len:209 (+),score=20.32 TRINITY_DN18683_c0_g1_i1:60-686(+)
MNLFHPSKKDPEARKVYSNGRPDLPQVLFVGRMSPEKQVMRLVDLVKLVNPPGQPECYRFVLVCPGEAWQDIYDQISERPDVHMPGAVKGEALAKLFASADVLFSPTITGTCDLVFIEAQASGLALVGPNVVGVPYVITDGENGRLYKALDMEDAALCVKDALKNLEEYKKKCTSECSGQVYLGSSDEGSHRHVPPHAQVDQSQSLMR